MKLGIFSDIHGNIYAFEKIWKRLKKESCDLYFFLGDICGYYYQNEVIEILKDIKNLMSVMGNHDDMFLKAIEDDKIEKDYVKTYGKSCRILKKEIKSDNLKFLKNLPHKIIIDEYKMAIFHGSPWDYLDEYIYPTSSLERFYSLPYRFVLLGHTHYPMNIKARGVRIINPGSCGQPRDYNQPSYAMLELKSGVVEFKRVQYNTGLMIKDILKYKEKNFYLTEILKRTVGAYA